MLKETTRNLFDGGIADTLRSTAQNQSGFVTNFDVLTDPRKATPYRSSESGDSSASTNTIKNFCIGLGASSTYRLFGLGQTASAAKIFVKDLTTGSANDLDDAVWTATSNNTSGSGAVDFNLFVFYKNTGFIYGGRSGRYIFKYDPTGVAAFGETEADLSSFTNLAQGLVHSKDDILYIPHDNKISKNNAGSWTVPALTLPTHFVITSICEYGNYLAIACAPVSGIGNSRVFLWDRDATINTLSESIDAGVGSIKILEEVDGLLVAISQRGGTSSMGGGGPAGTISFVDRVIFQYLNGSRFEKFYEMTGGSNTTKLPIAKQKVNSRLYFSMLINYNGAIRDGVFSIGRSSPSSGIALIHERTSNNDTALAVTDSIFGFYAIGDYLFISYTTTAGTVVAMSKTLATATYTASSVIESVRFDAGDASRKKELVRFRVKTEFLPSNASVTVKYRVDQNTSWTTILTNSTANSISASAGALQSSPNPFPKDYKEIEFQILSTGGAEVTGYYFEEEITDKGI